MKYLPSVAISIATMVAVSVGLYLTKDPLCLSGLFGLVGSVFTTPRECNLLWNLLCYQ